MALNKSNKTTTPSSKSGYFPELTASAGKQTNFLLPVRIKMTPNTSARPLSDGKKNPAKMMQPVLIKDLLASTHKKEKLNTTTLASTQKKKTLQSTQSCYKPKKEGEASFLNKTSCGENKVRRQLYQNLDSPHRSAAESKENKPKNNIIRYTQEAAAKNSVAQTKPRKSLLPQPDSIKNTYVRKSIGISLKRSVKVPVKNSRVTLGNSSNVISRVTEAGKLQKNVRKNNLVKTEKVLPHKIDKNDEMKLHHSDEDEPFTLVHKQDPRDVYIDNTKLNKNKNLLTTDPIDTLCRCTHLPQKTNKPEVDFNEVSNLDYYSFLQMRTFLEKTLIDSEIQTSNLRKVLNLVNNIFMNSVVAEAISAGAATTTTNSVTTTTAHTPLNENEEDNENCDVSSTMNDSSDKSNTSKGIDKTFENTNTSNETNNLAEELDKIKVQDEAEKICAEDKLPIPIKILVTEADMNSESKETSSEMLELARLSTIGEVSCEVDLSNKDENNEIDNKEKTNGNTYSILLTPTTPITPKILSRSKTWCTDNNCDSQTRRRSARLAAKRASTASLDLSDKQDSFTMLENELNVVVNENPSSQSVPSTPMKPPATPGIIKQFDKSMLRPLKEYMALKSSSKFLVTPDVKRFQSNMESIDTPHSRKSMSRKVFIELCDLYAESPENK